MEVSKQEPTINANQELSVTMPFVFWEIALKGLGELPGKEMLKTWHSMKTQLEAQIIELSKQKAVEKSKAMGMKDRIAEINNKNHGSDLIDAEVSSNGQVHPENNPDDASS